MSTNISAVLESRGEVKRLNRELSERQQSVVTLIWVIVFVCVGLILTILGVDEQIGILGILGVASVILGAGIGFKSADETKRLETRLAELRQDTVIALEALERNFPAMINAAANGAQGFVSDLAYKLLSKWLKLGHADGQHAHLREHVLDMRVGLAIVALHHPALMRLNEDGLIEGKFSFDNVREMGACSLKWTLNKDGSFTLRMDHTNPKGGAGWSTVIAQ